MIWIGLCVWLIGAIASYLVVRRDTRKWRMYTEQDRIRNIMVSFFFWYIMLLIFFFVVIPSSDDVEASW